MTDLWKMQASKACVASGFDALDVDDNAIEVAGTDLWMAIARVGEKFLLYALNADQRRRVVHSGTLESTLADALSRARDYEQAWGDRSSA